MASSRSPWPRGLAVMSYRELTSRRPCRRGALLPCEGGLPTGIPIRPHSQMCGWRVGIRHKAEINRTCSARICPNCEIRGRGYLRLEGPPGGTSPSVATALRMAASPGRGRWRPLARMSLLDSNIKYASQTFCYHLLEDSIRSVLGKGASFQT